MLTRPLSRYGLTSAPAPWYLREQPKSQAGTGDKGGVSRHSAPPVVASSRKQKGKNTALSRAKLTCLAADSSRSVTSLQTAPTSVASDDSLLAPVSPTPKTSSKTVTFDKTAKVAPTLSRKDYSGEEIKATWFQAEEYKSMKSLALLQLRMAKETGILRYSKCTAKILPSSPAFCLRGLENLARQGRNQRRDAIVEARRAVFLCQESQISSENIALIYRQHAMSSRIQAQARGFEDARTL